jgi:hypothetical protein
MLIKSVFDKDSVHILLDKIPLEKQEIKARIDLLEGLRGLRMMVA